MNARPRAKIPAAPVRGVPAPEPAEWVLLIVGAGLTGVALRRRKASTLAA